MSDTKIVKLVNLTRTALNFKATDGTVFSVPSSGEIRLSMLREKSLLSAEYRGKLVKINDIKISCISDLPPVYEDTIYVVPLFVYNAIGHLREDIYIPDEPSKVGSVTKHASSISRPVFTSLTDDMLLIESIITSMNLDDVTEDVLDKLISIKAVIAKYKK